MCPWTTLQSSPVISFWGKNENTFLCIPKCMHFISSSRYPTGLFEAHPQPQSLYPIWETKRYTSPHSQELRLCVDTSALQICCFWYYLTQLSCRSPKNMVWYGMYLSSRQAEVHHCSVNLTVRNESGRNAAPGFSCPGSEFYKWDQVGSWNPWSVLAQSGLRSCQDS